MSSAKLTKRQQKYLLLEMDWLEAVLLRKILDYYITISERMLNAASTSIQDLQPIRDRIELSEKIRCKLEIITEGRAAPLYSTVNQFREVRP